MAKRLYSAGANNGDEFAAGTVVTDPLSVLRVKSESFANGEFRPPRHHPAAKHPALFPPPPRRAVSRHDFLMDFSNIAPKCRH